MASALEKKQIVLDDLLTTYYFHDGGKKKPTLLLLHGWRSQSSAWNPIVEKLVDSYNMYLLDLPGFGGTQTPKAPWTHTDYTTFVFHFIQKLELENVVVIGHSVGGSVALKLAAKYAETIKKLVLVNSSGLRVKSGGVKAKILFAKIAKPFFAPSFMKALRNKIYAAMGAEDYISTPELRQTYLNIIEEDLTPLLSQIKTPTLIIWGAEDRETPPSMAQTMHSEIKNSQLHIIDNAGHYSFLDNPSEFTSTLNSFIQS